METIGMLLSFIGIYFSCVLGAWCISHLIGLYAAYRRLTK